MIRAVIFDFDGTIANTEPIHYELFSKILGEEGIAISQEENSRYYLHLNDQDSFHLALTRNEKLASPEIVASLVNRKSSYFKERINTLDLLFPDAADFIRRTARDYPIGIASGALDGEIELILGKAGLLSLFPVVIGAEKVEIGKPHPECYLEALRRLNLHFQKVPEIKPAEVLVIEDSIGGIEGVHRAGMVCLAVTNSYSRRDLREADFVVDRLSEIDFKSINSGLAEKK
jgi:beta-phosphoglucomutase